MNIKKQVSFIKTKIITESVKRSKSAVPPVRNHTLQKKSLKRKSDEVFNKEKNEFNPQPQLKKAKQESNKIVTRSLMPTSKKVTFSK